VLTVGMAVDANILIYERIREELRNGVSPRAAIAAGFDRAFSAIFDSNVTAFIAGVVLLFAVAALPDYLFTQRWPYAKEGWDYSQVADVISAHAAAGDCVMVDNTVPWKPGPVRSLLAARPAAYRPLIDVGRGAYGPKVGWLWDGHVAVWLVTAKINKCTTVWTITDHDNSLPDHQAGQSLPPGSAFGRAPAYRFPAYLGFHIVERWQFHYSQVIKSTR